MTDEKQAEDRPEPPPRRIEWVQFSGESHGPQGMVLVAVSSSFDPYRAETLIVHGYSPLGDDHLRYLTRRGDWADTRLGTEIGDEGFEMPPGFAKALKDAFTRELQQAKEAAVGAVEAADAIVEGYKRAADMAARAGELMAKNVEHLQGRVNELEAELEGWRDGLVTRA